MQYSYQAFLKRYDVVKMITLDRTRLRSRTEIYTPLSLVKEMHDKLPVDFWKSPTNIIADLGVKSGVFLFDAVERFMVGLEPLESNEDVRFTDIVKNQIWGFCCSPWAYASVSRVLFGEIESEEHIYNQSFLDSKGKIHKNVLKILKKNKRMNFDAIVGNPPYQKKVGPKKTEPIWQLFVEQSIKSLVDDGWLCLVHPSGWRNVDGNFKDVGNLITSRNVRYLEIHNKADGNRTFGASTPYDWYVLQNRTSTGKTTVKFQDGVVKTLDLTKLPFIPNGSFDQVMRLVAKNGEKTCEVLHDHMLYEVRPSETKPWMSPKKYGKFQHPVIYTVKSGDIANCWFTSKKDEHFGVSKVIWSNGGITMGVIADYTGEYGLSQFAYAIVDEPKNLPKIKEAITSDAFKKMIVESTDDGSINRRVLALFRKDFWKDFV